MSHAGDIYLQRCSQFSLPPKTDVLKLLRADFISKLSLTSEFNSLEALVILDSIQNTPVGSIRINGALKKVISSSKHLSKLSLRNVSLSSQSILELCDGITLSPALDELSLAEITFSDSSFSSFCSSLTSNSSISSLMLSCCSITDRHAELLSSSISNKTTLHSLLLENNDITYIGADHLASAFLHNSSICDLSLAGNPISNRGLTSLSPVLTNFRTIDLRACLIGPHGIASLTQCLSDNSSSLVALALDDNRIGSKGAVAIARVLTSLKHLEELRLNNNKIGDSGAVSLAYAVAMHSSVVRLHLDDNLIGDKGGDTLANVYQSNRKIELISVAGNYISEEGEEMIRQTIANVIDFEGEIDIEQQNDYLPGEDSFMTRELEEWFLVIVMIFSVMCWELLTEVLAILKSLSGVMVESTVNFELIDKIPTMIDLSNQSLTNDDVMFLTEALKHCQTISVIHIHNCNFDSQMSQTLSSFLINNNILKTFSLRNHVLSSDSCFSLGQALSSSTVEEIVLSDGRNIDDKGFGLFLKGLGTHKNNVRLIDFSRLSITSSGLIALGKYVTGSLQLADLCLDGNDFSRSQDLVTFLSMIVKINSSIHTLSLRDCKISSDCVGAIVDLLEKKGNFMKNLNLDDNLFNEDDVSTLLSICEQSFCDNLSISVRIKSKQKSNRFNQSFAGSRTPKKSAKSSKSPIFGKIPDTKVDEELEKVQSQLDALILKKGHLLSMARSQKEEEMQRLSETLLETSLSDAMESKDLLAPPIHEIPQDFLRDFERSSRTFTANIAVIEARISGQRKSIESLRGKSEDCETLVNDLLQKRVDLIEEIKKALTIEEGFAKAEGIQSDQKRNQTRYELSNAIQSLKNDVSDLESHYRSRQQYFTELLVSDISLSSGETLLYHQAYAQLVQNLSKLAELRSFCGLVEDRDKQAFDEWTMSKKRLEEARSLLAVAEKEEIKSYEMFIQARRCTQEALQEERLMRTQMGVDIETLEGTEMEEIAKKVLSEKEINEELIPLAQQNLEFYGKLNSQRDELGLSVSRVYDENSEYFNILENIHNAEKEFETAKEKLSLAREARQDADTLRNQLNSWNIQISKLETSITVAKSDQNRAISRGDLGKFRDCQSIIDDCNRHLEALLSEKSTAEQDLSRLENMAIDAESHVEEVYGAKGSEYFLIFDKMISNEGYAVDE
ncbi:hypothetical protein GEMRC1_009466 [Eukaryota sp. GEM-RC1]